MSGSITTEVLVNAPAASALSERLAAELHISFAQAEELKYQIDLAVLAEKAEREPFLPLAAIFAVPGFADEMGGEIVSTGSSAIVSGPTPLHGAHVRALDVRAGAAVLLAALAAQGTTYIDEIAHLDRGYEHLEEKLRSLGVEIERT